MKNVVAILWLFVALVFGFANSAFAITATEDVVAIAPVTHTVESGNTLTFVSEKFKLDRDTIVKANPFLMERRMARGNDDLIKVGEVILIPAPQKIVSPETVTPVVTPAVVHEEQPKAAQPTPTVRLNNREDTLGGVEVSESWFFMILFATAFSIFVLCGVLYALSQKGTSSGDDVARIKEALTQCKSGKKSPTVRDGQGNRINLENIIAYMAFPLRLYLLAEPEYRYAQIIKHQNTGVRAPREMKDLI